jgi:hypothetical protein
VSVDYHFDCVLLIRKPVKLVRILFRNAESCKNQTLDMRALNNPLLLDVVSTKSTKKVDQSDYSRKLGITLVGISL